MTDPNDSMTERVSDYLGQQSVELDPSTHKRLDEIRQQAVMLAEQQNQRAQGRFNRSWLVNAGYAAAFGLAVVAGVLTFKAQPTPDVNTPSSLELVLLNEDFEMLEEDLAFYDWMETELINRG